MKSQPRARARVPLLEIKCLPDGRNQCNLVGSSTLSSSQKGTKFEVSSSLGLQIWKSSFGDFCLFSVAFTTPRTALSLYRCFLGHPLFFSPFRVVRPTQILGIFQKKKILTTFLSYFYVAQEFRWLILFPTLS